jgi:hypothetical protein
MKRCPQCEFIYEDDQSLCDMDGALLVFDSRSLPNLHALAPIEVPLPPKAHWRHRTFPAMAALILATVLSLVYFVSTQRTAHAPTPLPISDASITTPITNRVAPAADTPPPSADVSEVNGANGAAGAAKEETRPESAKRNTPAPAPAAAAAKKAAAKTPTTQSKPAEEPKKENSKVGSILKKTGRILKKPFKF